MSFKLTDKGIEVLNKQLGAVALKPSKRQDMIKEFQAEERRNENIRFLEALKIKTPKDFIEKLVMDKIKSEKSQDADQE